MDLVSIIIPVYNIREYVENCIISAINQSYKDIEIIIVDDGSTDGSGDICNRYAEIDSRIVVISQSNGGLSSARNTGIDNSKGDWLFFLDGDDYIHPQTVEILLSITNSKNVPMSVCSLNSVSEYNTNYEGYDLSSQKICIIQREEALRTVSVPACGKLYSKEMFDKLRFPLKRLHEDEFIFAPIVYRAKEIGVVDEPLYFYLQRENSITHTVSFKNIEDSFGALEERIRYIEEQRWYEAREIVLKQYTALMYHFCFYASVGLGWIQKRDLWNRWRRLILKYDNSYRVGLMKRAHWIYELFWVWNVVHTLFIHTKQVLRKLIKE